MAHSSQDSASIPSSSGSQRLASYIRQQVRADGQSTRDYLAGQLELQASKIDQQGQNMEILRNQTMQLQAKLTDLQGDFRAVREFAEAASNSAAHARAAEKYMERTVERVNVLAEITLLFIDVLVVPLYEVLHKIVQFRTRLEARTYSRKDGVDITPLVNRRQDR